MKATLLLLGWTSFYSLASSYALVSPAGRESDDLALHKNNNKEPKDHEYRKWKDSDSRSPCPGLNALANHAFLPHSGKNISLALIQSSISTAYNYDPHILDSVVAQTLAANISSTGNPLTFNLQDLAAHNVIEFDGSLSRNDFDVSHDDLHFDPRVWGPVARNMGLSDGKGPGGKYVTIETAGRARAIRFAEARRVNGKFVDVGFPIAAGTTGLFLTTLWDDEADKGAPKVWVRPFFEEDRIPYCEGFQRPVKVKTGEILGARVQAVAAITI